LLGKTNLARMAKSKVVLDYKFKHANRELGELLTCQRIAPGGAYIGEASRPGPTGLGCLWLLPGSGFSSMIIFTL
jgi:hypothetical protein